MNAHSINIMFAMQMLAHHSITGALVEAIGYASRHHPYNPRSEAEKRQDKKEQESMAGDLESIRVEGGEDGGAVENAMDILSQTS